MEYKGGNTGQRYRDHRFDVFGQKAGEYYWAAIKLSLWLRVSRNAFHTLSKEQKSHSHSQTTFILPEIKANSSQYAMALFKGIKAEISKEQKIMWT